MYRKQVSASTSVRKHTLVIEDTVRMTSRTTIDDWMYTAKSQRFVSYYILYILNITYI